MKRLKTLIAALFTGLFILNLAACGSTPNAQPGGSQEQGSGSAAAPQEPKGTDSGDTLILGTSADYAPYEYHKLVDGEDKIVGFDMEIGKLIAEKLGKKLEIKDLAFDACLVELNLGKVDIVIAGMSPDPERDADFSDIYYKTTQCVMIRESDKDKYTDIASLKGKVVGAQTSTAQAKALEADMPESEALLLQKVPDLLMNLKTGKSEAVVMERLVAKSYMSNGSGLMIAFELPYTTEGCAVAVKKGNTELLGQINDVLKQMQESGELEQAIDKAAKDAADVME